MRSHSRAEPAFEAPPPLASPGDRRLSVRAVAQWTACCSSSRLPAAAAFELGEFALGCANASIWLTGSNRAVCASSVGDEVAAAFDLGLGQLVPAERTLRGELHAAFCQLSDQREPSMFEASLPAGQMAGELLTRGVLLPLLDAAGELTRAMAILTWKQVLGDIANTGLRGEVSGAIAAGRAARRSPTDFQGIFGLPATGHQPGWTAARSRPPVRTVER